MTTASLPPPCDPAIFKDGTPIALLDARSKPAETWVRRIAQKANAKVDWHYSGGIAQVLHLGDDESRTRVEAAITELASALDGRIMRRYPPELQADGLYRSGVTE